jgi:UDPglucose 6-dehydrogenase
LLRLQAKRNFVNFPIMEIGVVGLGYLGATHAIALASSGHKVIGYDINDSNVGSLSSGVIPFHEPGLQSLLDQTILSGSFQTTNSIHALSDCEIVFICVGTPQVQGSRELDVSAIMNVGRELSVILGDGTLVVGKSTAPVGTAQKLRKVMAKSSGRSNRVAWNPEFLREGSALYDTFNPSRIVVGAEDERDYQLLRDLHAEFIPRDTPYLEVSLATAELIKMAANSFLAMKLSFINSIANLCDATGANAFHVAEALGLDPRIGGHFLQHGIGYGGGCLPKDIAGFAEVARSNGLESLYDLLRSVERINTEAAKVAVDLASDLLRGANGNRVLILGAAFKPESDDTRHSPSLSIAMELHEIGADVTVHDPVAAPKLLRSHPDIKFVDELANNVRGIDVIVLGTAWPEYRDLDPDELGKLVAHKNIIDGRGFLDRNLWRSAGWNYLEIGSKAHGNV